MLSYLSLIYLFPCCVINNINIYNIISLTDRDVDTGKNWFYNMDLAAQAYGIKLQFCMADVYHLLQSTSIYSVTNARATGDNTRNWPSIHSMGQTSLLFYALGVYASRDNVWTSAAGVNQTGCGKIGRAHV